MANCVDYNCDDPIGEIHENECGVEFVGDFNAAVLLHCDHEVTDPSNGTQVLAAINANKATLITGALFDIEDPAPTLVDSTVPCRPQTITEIKRTGNYNNPNVNSDNDEPHDTLFSGKVFGGLIIRECSSAKNGYDQCKFIDEAISFTGGLSAKTKTKQGYIGKFNWTSLKNPKTIATPPGVYY